jgi:hypothetical protein
MFLWKFESSDDGCKVRSPAFTEGLSDGRCFYCSSLTHSA